MQTENKKMKKTIFLIILALPIHCIADDEFSEENLNKILNKECRSISQYATNGKQYFDQKLQKKLWRFDVTVDGVRYREKGIPTQRRCIDYITELRMDARLQRLGLRPKQTTVTLTDLAEKPEIDRS